MSIRIEPLMRTLGCLSLSLSLTHSLPLTLTLTPSLAPSLPLSLPLSLSHTHTLLCSCTWDIADTRGPQGGDAGSHLLEGVGGGGEQIARGGEEQRRGHREAKC